MPEWAFAQAAAPPAPSGTIRGTVLDRAGGTPIADVSVRIQDAAQAVTTDAAGRFELRDVSPGPAQSSSPLSASSWSGAPSRSRAGKPWSSLSS